MEPPKPPVPRELVEWLEKTYQDRCPDHSMSDREVWIAAGSAVVVRKLRQLLNAQHQP